MATEKMPETLEELNALITERILMYHQRLQMDGRLLPDVGGPKYGLPSISKMMGFDPDLTGDLSTAEFIESMR